MAEKLRSQAAGKAFVSVGFYIPLALGLGFIVILFVVGGFLSRYFPAYNFCWGDYLETFRKRESTRKFILVVVVLGIVISFVGSVLATFIRHGQ